MQNQEETSLVPPEPITPGQCNIYGEVDVNCEHDHCERCGYAIVDEKCDCELCPHCGDPICDCECPRCEACGEPEEDCECPHCERCGELLQLCECEETKEEIPDTSLENLSIQVCSAISKYEALRVETEKLRIERGVECSVCVNASRDRILRCGHTFCFECVKKMEGICAYCRDKFESSQHMYFQ